MNRELINIVAFVSSLIIVIGCFLPWIQLGALFRNRGIDSPDGAVILVSAIITGSVAYFNQKKKLQHFTWTYVVVGLGVVYIAIMDLIEAFERSIGLADNLNELVGSFGGEKEFKQFSFVGSGLYTVVFGAFGLFLVGIIDLNRYSLKDLLVYFTKENDAVHSGKSLDAYEEKVAILLLLISEEKSNMFFTKNKNQIISLIDDFCDSTEKSIQLLNFVNSKFGKNLVEELKSCSSDYHTIKSFLGPLIMLEIVDETYPHAIKSAYASQIHGRKTKVDDEMKIHEFDEVWRKYIIPLEGKTIVTEKGAKNQLIQINDFELRRISSKGNESSIAKAAFREIYQELLLSKEISRIAVNEKYSRRGSSLICAVLAQIPFISLTVKNGTIHLVIE